MAVQGRYSTAYEDTAPAGPAFSDADINAYVQANIGNPQAIADAAQQYGVSAADLSRATGYDANTVSNYFGNAGINMWGQPAQQATTPPPVPPQPPVYQPPQEPIYEPVYQPPQPPVYQPPGVPPPQTPIDYNDPGFAPPTPVTSPQDPNSVQQRIIEEERKRNLEGGLASLGAGSTRPESLPNYSSPKPVDLGNGTFRTYGGTIIDSQGYPVVTPDEAYKIYTQARLNATKDAQALLSFTGPREAATQASMNQANALQAKAGADALARIGYFVDANGEMVKGTRPTATTPVTTATTPVTTATTATAPVTTATTPAATATTPVTAATAAATAAAAAAANKPAVETGPSIASLYQSYLGRAPEAGGAEYWNNKFGPTIDAAEEAEFKAATQGEQKIIKDFVSGVTADTALSPWEQVNKIMETAQSKGVGTDQLTKIYGKETVDKYLKTYGTGIKDFITGTLGDKTKSDFDKVAVINQAAGKYGLDADEIAKYSGLNKKGVDQMFTTFETGLASIAKNLSAPTVSDLDKTKGVLSLQSKYGISNDQVAKAIGGNVTGKDVEAYLAPVKSFSTDLQTITSDQTKTASDIQTFLDKAKKDPRIEGLYGLAIDKVQKAVPILGLRDSIAGNGSPEQLTKGYTDFVAAVNSDPALKEKYGAQADAIDKVAKMSQRIADEKFGGKLQPHMFQTFIGLDQKTISDVPKQLGMTDSTTQTITDNEGQQQTYTTPGQVKDTKGLEPVYTIIGSGEDQSQQLAGYTKPIKTSAGVTVDAQYDVNGTLTGYRGRPEDKVWPAHRVGVTGVWDAEGKAKPEQRVETVGFAKNLIKDVADLGPIGQLAIAFATSGLGSLAAGALTPALGATAAKVVTSGLINGAMAEMGGGQFGKGFLTGAAGAGTNVLAQNYMPTIDTGNAFADQYFNKALPNLATSTVGAALNKQDIGQAGLSSLVNTGANMATSNLINSAMPDTLTPEMQKMFTGVSGQLLSSLLQGQSPDIQKAVVGTIMQNAMSPSKTAAKEKG
jgi:hypothetical protein